MEHGFLKSMGIGNRLWAPYEPMQAEKVPDHGSEGVHAFKTLSHALEYTLPRYGPVVVGRVQLWGQVVEHEKGYRAEYGEIIALDYMFEHGAPVKHRPWRLGPHPLDRLRAEYGVFGAPRLGP